MKPCPICGAARSLAFRHVVLAKYDCGYHYCNRCGLLQTDPPYWLDEAYSSAISQLDTGIIHRNIRASKILSLVLPYISKRDGRYLDIAGGFGMLARLMRDRGFDYYWSDRYCENLFARGFEAQDQDKFDVVTAFEVMEHVIDPLEFISSALKHSGSKTLVFSTEVFSGLPPDPRSWWYYAFESGQHITFFQRRTIRYIAGRLGLNCVTGKSIHILTDKAISTAAFRVLTSSPFAEALAPLTKFRYQSKMMSDHRELSARLSSVEQ